MAEEALRKNNENKLLRTEKIHAVLFVLRIDKFSPDCWLLDFFSLSNASHRCSYAERNSSLEHYFLNSTLFFCFFLASTRLFSVG